jgi:hypothetical protein
MAGTRLEYWSTLSKEEIQRRVKIESARTDLTFAQTQLLDAALERLRTWRGPSRTPREMKVKGDEDADTELKEAEAPAIEEKVKDKKPKRARKAKVKAEPEAAEVEHSDFHTGLNGETDKPAAEEKETKVARTASKARKGKKRDSAGKVAKTKKEAGTKARSRIDPEAKVTKISGAANPFREGSGSYKRVETVWKASGKTAEAISKLTGVLPQTLSNMKKLGLIKIG